MMGRIFLGQTAICEIHCEIRKTEESSRANWPLLEWATALPPRHGRVTANLHSRSAGATTAFT